MFIKTDFTTDAQNVLYLNLRRMDKSDHGLLHVSKALGRL
jgi:hypothetical protein